MSDLFARALEGESLSEDEVKQLWAESPVVRDTALYNAITEALDADPKELAKLRELAQQQPVVKPL